MRRAAVSFAVLALATLTGCSMDELSVADGVEITPARDRENALAAGDELGVAIMENYRVALAQRQRQGPAIAGAGER